MVICVCSHIKGTRQELLAGSDISFTPIEHLLHHNYIELEHHVWEHLYLRNSKVGIDVEYASFVSHHNVFVFHLCLKFISIGLVDVGKKSFPSVSLSFLCNSHHCCSGANITLEHRATSQNGVGSVPDYVIGDFYWHSSFRSHCGRRVYSASNRNEAQEYSLGSKGCRCLGLDNLNAFMPRLSWNLRASSSWNPRVVSRAV